MRAKGPLFSGIRRSCSSIAYRCLLRGVGGSSSIITVASNAPAIVKFARSGEGRTNDRFISMNVTRRATITLTSNVTMGNNGPFCNMCDSFMREAFSRMSRSIYVGGDPVAVMVCRNSMCKVGSIARLNFRSVPVLSGVPGLMCLTPTAGRRCLTVLS